MPNCLDRDSNAYINELKDRIDDLDLHSLGLSCSDDGDIFKKTKYYCPCCLLILNEATVSAKECRNRHLCSDVSTKYNNIIF